MTADLFVKHAGVGPAVVLLHGLFGAGGNLGVLARELQRDFTVYSLDLPGHGRSRWLPNLDLPLMADSVQRWLNEEGRTCAHFIGHSLGGKVAMQLALQYPASVVSLVVADIAPVNYTGHHDAVFAGLEAVIAQRCTNREEAAALLLDYVHEQDVVQFLLSSLQRETDGTYRWRFDVAGLKAAYPALLSAPEARGTYSGPVLFIRGGASDYLRDGHRAAIQSLFPVASIETMPGCGHWLHAEQPQQFNAIVRRFLEAAEHRKLQPIQGGER
jgi:esterase